MEEDTEIEANIGMGVEPIWEAALNPHDRIKAFLFREELIMAIIDVAKEETVRTTNRLNLTEKELEKMLIKRVETLKEKFGLALKFFAS